MTGNPLPTLKTDEFTKIQKVNISEEIQWFTAFVNSSVLTRGRGGDERAMELFQPLTAPIASPISCVGSQNA
jgi:hypothetical protein